MHEDGGGDHDSNGDYCPLRVERYPVSKVRNLRNLPDCKEGGNEAEPVCCMYYPRQSWNVDYHKGRHKPALKNDIRCRPQLRSDYQIDENEGRRYSEDGE